MELVASHRGAHRSFAAAIALALAAALVPASAARAEPAEYEVKAAFLYNFARFVEWPEPPAAGGTDFAFCLLGGADVEASMTSVMRGRTVGELPVVVRRIEEGAETGECRLLFVANGGAARARAWLRGIEGPVLVVGEGEGFARDPGMIGFVEVSRKLRFDVNRRRAEGVGLRVSSHLLKLAREVVE